MSPVIDVVKGRGPDIWIDISFSEFTEKDHYAIVPFEDDNREQVRQAIYTKLRAYNKKNDTDIRITTRVVRPDKIFVVRRVWP